MSFTIHTLTSALSYTEPYNLIPHAGHALSFDVRPAFLEGSLGGASPERHA